MAQGWVSIHRQLNDNWLWKDKPFSKGQAWIDILLRVNHKPGRVPVGNSVIDINPGETLWSVKDMAEKWGWSRKKVDNFLNILQTEMQITKKSTTKYTLITVEKWELYQTEEQQKNINGTSNEHQKNTNNNKNNKDNENTKSMYGEIFDYYCSLDLVKHRSLTGDMKKAIDKATKELGLDVEYMKRMLDRHSEKVNATVKSEYPIKKRPLAEFFGQKKYNSVSLICTDYLDENYTESKSEKSDIDRINEILQRRADQC